MVTSRNTGNINLKLGRKPTRRDVRTIRLDRILKALPPLPEEFYVDSQYSYMVDENMYLNDKYGCCVIAGRAHNTLRFEAFEQGSLVPITDDEVKTEYFKETGGTDSGLVMLDSLIAWKNGWTAASKNYDIYAFAQVEPTDHLDIKASIYLLNGVYCGLIVPNSAMTQFEGGKTWEVVEDDGGLLGGHCVYVLGYDSIGPTCITWGKKQKMTWAFWDKYMEECYGVIDNIDAWVESSPVDLVKLKSYLDEILGSSSQKISVLTSSLPRGTVGLPYSYSLSAQGGALPYEWTCNASLPPGLSLSGEGVISGTPTEAMIVSNMTFMVKDSLGNQSGVILTLTIWPVPTPSKCKWGNSVATVLNKVFLLKERNRQGRFAYMDNMRYNTKL